jgi:hypothetical protein
MLVCVCATVQEKTNTLSARLTFGTGRSRPHVCLSGARDPRAKGARGFACPGAPRPLPRGSLSYPGVGWTPPENKCTHKGQRARARVPPHARSVCVCVCVCVCPRDTAPDPHRQLTLCRPARESGICSGGGELPTCSLAFTPSRAARGTGATPRVRARVCACLGWSG